MFFGFRALKKSNPNHDPATGEFASASGTPASKAGLSRVGGALGSNPGGQFTDAGGRKFYIKESKSAAHASNEILAGHLYHAAGAPIVQAHKIDLGAGKVGTVSAWQQHEGHFDPTNATHVAEARKNFGAHAWLGNWDAVGMANDNQVPIAGKLTTVDAGGSLKFRAQGGPKSSAQYGPNVSEVSTMRDPSMNPQAAAVFGGMSSQELHDSAKGVAGVSDATIHALVQQHGYGTVADRAKDADLLVARKKSLLSQTGW